MVRFRGVCVVCLAVAVSGCAHWVKPEIKETLTTHISQTGLKSFVYIRKLIRPESEEDEDYRRGRYGGEFGGGPRTEELMDRKIDAKLDELGYCREGYFIYRRESDWNYTSARGECRETATPADRARFPNEVENPDFNRPNGGARTPG